MIDLDDFDIDSTTVKLNNDNDNPMATNIVICSDFVVNRYCGAQPLTIIDVPNKQTSIVAIVAIVVVVVVVVLGDMLLHRHFKEVEVDLLLLLLLLFLLFLFLLLTMFIR
jgi:purine-cytosine permease-like protein